MGQIAQWNTGIALANLAAQLHLDVLERLFDLERLI